MTNTTLTDWSNYEFAVIEAGDVTTEHGRPATDTVGHVDASCKRIKGSVLARETSLARWCEQNEWFDGEYVYHVPWPCQCLSIDTSSKGHAQSLFMGMKIDAGTGEILDGEPVELPFAEDVMEKAYATARNLGRKFEDSDLTDDLRKAANRYADEYVGDFDFMIKARKMTRRTDGVLRAVLNCLRAEALRGGTPKAPSQSGEPEAVVAPEAVVKATNVKLAMPAGKYDVPTAVGRVTFEISHGSDNWDGWVFVRVRNEKVGQQRPGETYRGRYAELVSALAADPVSAAAAFGRRTTVCGICGITLEDPKSVERGIGPICFKALRGQA